LVLVLFSFISFVNAGSIGISPAKIEYFFEPGLEKEVSFKITNAESDKPLTAYVNGDLAEYVTLSETSFVGSGSFVAVVKLPEEISLPGTHRILIGAIESDTSGDEVSVIGGIAAVQAVIEITVPYPGKYLEASFKIEDVNEGENIPFELELENLGTENLEVLTTLEVYEGDFNGAKVNVKTLNSQKIESKKKIILKDFLDGADLKTGSYFVDVTLDYGSELKLNETFRIGHFFIDILDYSYVFEAWKINPFNIKIGNVWNSKMNDVYSEVSITDEGRVIGNFKTPSVNLEPWEETNLTGYFDALEIGPGKYTANIKVFYEQDSNFKLVKIYVEEKGIDGIWITIIILVFLIIILVLAIFFYLIIKIRRLKKNVKENYEENKL